MLNPSLMSEVKKLVLSTVVTKAEFSALLRYYEEVHKCRDAENAFLAYGNGGRLLQSKGTTCTDREHNTSRNLQGISFSLQWP